MSREEAARIYIDVLIGFRNNYRLYQRAANILSVKDREMLNIAVSDTVKSGADHGDTETFFTSSN